MTESLFPGNEPKKKTRKSQRARKTKLTDEESNFLRILLAEAVDGIKSNIDSFLPPRPENDSEKDAALRKKWTERLKRAEDMLEAFGGKARGEHRQRRRGSPRRWRRSAIERMRSASHICRRA